MAKGSGYSKVPTEDSDRRSATTLTESDLEFAEFDDTVPEQTSVADKTQDNHAKLQVKRARVLGKVQEHLQTETSLEEKISAVDKARETQFPKSDLTTPDDLGKAIAVLTKRKDARIGILNDTVGEGEDKVRIRDARGQFAYLGRKVKEEIEADPANKSLSEEEKNERISAGIVAKLKEEAPEKYAIQILNEVRAGITLLEQDGSLAPEKREEAEAKLYLLAENALKPDNLGKLSEDIEAYNSQIVSTLGEAGITKPAEKLNFAKEVSSFNDEHTHIATVASYQGNRLVELDVKLDPLSDTQKKEYKRIAAGQEGEKLGIDWFDGLEPYKQELIRRQAGKIAKGKMVIPAQLRELSGLRNAYEKSTSVMDEQGKLKTVVSSLHLGAPASKAGVKPKKTMLEKLSLGFYKSKATKEAEETTKETRAGIAEENMGHLASYAKDGKLNANILTSKTKGFDRGENWITKQVKGAAKGLVSFTASPINHFRLWFKGGQKHTQFETNLALIADKLSENKIAGTENIQKFLKGDKKISLEQVQKELEALQFPGLKKGLAKAIKAKEYVKGYNSFGDDENKNVEASAAIAVLDHAVKSEELSSLMKDSEYKESANFCKSGKDRTGYVELKASQHGVASELGVTEPSKMQEISFVFGAAGHTQTMAGTQGGTLGNDSIKTSGRHDALVSGEFTLSSADGHLEGIINQKSSGYNSEIKTEPKKKNSRAHLEAKARLGSSLSYDVVTAKGRQMSQGRASISM